MAMTKKELIEFLNGLVELASEENKAKAILVKEQFLSYFENTYGYEKEVITEISKLPPHYIAAMPDSVQEEIRQKVIAALTEHGECTPENCRWRKNRGYKFSGRKIRICLPLYRRM